MTKTDELLVEVERNERFDKDYYRRPAPLPLTAQDTSRIFKAHVLYMLRLISLDEYDAVCRGERPLL